MESFFYNLFELFGSVTNDASNDLYDYVYVGAGFIMIFLILSMVAVFYLLLFRKQAKWDTIRHWVLWLVISVLFTVIVILLYTDGKLTSEFEDSIPLVDYITFPFMVIFWSSVLFFLSSLFFKTIGHPSRRKIPF